MNKKDNYAFRLVSISLMLSASAWAQNTAVSGRVTDSSGTAMQNAAVQLFAAVSPSAGFGVRRPKIYVALGGYACGF